MTRAQAAFLAVLAATSGLYGHDLLEPAWRGQEGTTFQEWTFDDNDNPAYPEAIDNQYGSAVATISIGSFGSGWQNQLPGLGTQTGYWDIGAQGGGILLDIDNFNDPFESKEVWVQLTCWRDISQEPAIVVEGADYVDGEELVAEHVSTGGDWILVKSVWRIEPGQDHEQVAITSDPQWGSVIDQIVIDTLAANLGCVVDIDDLVKLCSEWLETGFGLEADLNIDENIDLADLAILAALWYEECPIEWPL